MEGMILAVIVGAVVGWSLGLITKDSSRGFVLRTGTGILGGVLGSWGSGFLDVTIGDEVVNWIVTPVIGAVILLFLFGFMKND